MKIISAGEVLNYNSKHAQELDSSCYRSLLPSPLLADNKTSGRRAPISPQDAFFFFFFLPILRLSSHQKKTKHRTFTAPHFDIWVTKDDISSYPASKIRSEIFNKKCRLVFHLCDVTGYTVRRVQRSVADETPQGSASPVPFPVKRKIITSLESLQTKQKNKKRERQDKQRQYIFPKASVRAVLLHCKLLPLADRWKQLWYYPVTSSEACQLLLLLALWVLAEVNQLNSMQTAAARDCWRHWSDVEIFLDSKTCTHCPEKQSNQAKYLVKTESNLYVTLWKLVIERHYNHLNSFLNLR